MFTLIAPPGISQLETRSGASYSVSGGTITVPLADLADALNNGFMPFGGGRSVTAQINGNITLQSNDSIVEIAVASGAVVGTITMPAVPVPYKVYTIADTGTNFGNYNQTLTPNYGQGAFLDNPLLNENGVSIDVFYNNTNWRRK